MDFTDAKNIGSEYKGFVVVNVEEIADYKSKGVYLRHKTTGLEVYHIVNDDKENLFSFCFRTGAKNSKGAAHITEHSVLCGSQKFPLKEPFNTLDQQSLKTFLNAMTYPEKTLYPGSSVVKADYYNLMDVYADAVFFPKLSRQTFLQEGWRVELDEKGKASIQGVVYNEMKANYSSFNSVAVDKMLAAMYPDSILDYDSGGDPLEIPFLTYDEFLNFHKKFYSPSNCLLFLYGDIPTNEQLDFICEKYIPRLEKEFGIIKEKDFSSKTPYVDDEIKEIQTFKRIDSIKEIKNIAPDNGASGNMVAVGFYAGSASIEQTFISEILSGNDSSPLTRKLKASKLGEDESPVNGSFNYVQNDCIFCYGLSGVKKGREKDVYNLVLNSFKEIYEEGINSDDIESAIMSIDFNLREKNRNFGPPSISIMSRTAASWAIGMSPSALLSRISDFEKIKAKVRENPDYIKELIKKYFIDAEIYLKFTAEPSKKYFEERNKKEKKTLAAFEKNIDKNQLKKELDSLHEYQEKLETEEELKCIPHLSVKKLESNIGQIDTDYFTVKGADGSDIPVLLNKQNTNGIIYLDVSYPFDSLSPEKLKYLDLYNNFTSTLGWGGMKWDDAIREEGKIFGNYGNKIAINTPRDCKDAEEIIDSYPDKNLAYRNLFTYCTKFISDKADKAFETLSKILTTTSYADVEHAETLFSEQINDLQENFVSNAGKYINLYAKHRTSIENAIKELVYGLSQLFNYRKISKKMIPDLLEKFEQMNKEIRAQGGIIHIICDDSDVEKVKKLLPSFALSSGLTQIRPKKSYPLQDYIAQIYEPENFDESKITYIQAPSQAGYAFIFSSGSSELTKEWAAENVLCCYLNGHQLWEKIRMQGGAYGCRCAVDGRAKLFSALSWRDPFPEKTLAAYTVALKEISEFNFTDEDIERCILSEYSDYIVPDSPAGYGNRGFTRYIIGYSNAQLKKDVEFLLKVNAEDVHNAALRLYKNIQEKSVKVVFCDNSINCCGNIIKIPL